MTNFKALIAAYSLLFIGFTALPSSGNERVQKLDISLKFLAQQPSSENKDSLLAIFGKEAKLERIATGFKFTEGALWHPDGFLLFSDTPANTIYKWTPDHKVEVFRCPAGYPNGNTLDREGRILTAQHDRSLTRTEKDGN